MSVSQGSRIGIRAQAAQRSSQQVADKGLEVPHGRAPRWKAQRAHPDQVT